MAMLLLFFLIAATSNLLASSQEASLHHHGRKQTYGKVNCQSWRIANEANNTVTVGTAIPDHCKGYVKGYLLGEEYSDDSYAVIEEAIDYIKHLPIPRDGRGVFIFDIDETSLSNIPYFLSHILWSESPYSIIPADWVYSVKHKGTMLWHSKRLYDVVLSLGVKVVFLTGRYEEQRESTIANLKQEGYRTWEKLILRSAEFENETATVFKSTVRGRLEEDGYRIVGNIGDQWSDITGPNSGRRTFKLPNPMYYLP